MLLDVLGLVGDHANERVQLDDCHTQVDQIHRVSQQSPQGRNEVCRRIEIGIETHVPKSNDAISLYKSEYLITAVIAMLALLST